MCSTIGQYWRFSPAIALPSHLEEENSDEKNMVCDSAAFGRLPRGARLFQHQRARIEGFQRTGDGNRLRWPIQWRLRAYKAEPGHDLRASGYPQDKASQLPRTARRGNGERIAHNELQFRCPE